MEKVGGWTDPAPTVMSKSVSQVAHESTIENRGKSELVVPNWKLRFGSCVVFTSTATIVTIHSANSAIVIDQILGYM